MGNRTCSLDGCGRPHRGLGYCHPHLERFRRTGDARPGEPISGRGPDRTPHRERHGKYALDEHYFDQIDTPEKAYWLGFITADGCVIRSGKRSYGLAVELAQRDAAHVGLLAAALASDRPLQRSVRGGPYGQRAFAVARFDSWRLVEALDGHGIRPRKSQTCEPWNGPADLMPHYWRGLFDGDGSIGVITTRGHWQMQVCGSEACVYGFASWSAAVSGSSGTPHLSTRSRLCWQWILAGTAKPQALALALYGRGGVALARKKRLSDELCAIDFAAKQADANVRRSETMRLAWRDRTHPRARLP